MRTLAADQTKRKMQDVSFAGVDDFMDYLPANEREIVSYLREIVFDCIPDCFEKLAYNVPFYRRHANICFIWPPAVLWGKTIHEGVRFGFTSGYLLNDEINYLDRGSRKQVWCKDFFKLSDIDAPLLKSYLFQAVEIDEEKTINKRKTKR